MFKILKKKKKGSNTTNNKAHMSLSNGNENVNHALFVENLLETAKGIKKEGWKGGKRLKGWVEKQLEGWKTIKGWVGKQPKKKTKITAKDNVGKKFS
jgi:hypothetical protein